ncbi:hypothetical protein LPJ61_003934 [Coemansia biformis]|uniref:Tyrosine specific protein phosphatases domain-containing protein n=1 Tax=Coemansia biformis TaxID=1286918 RepID=A0A9W7YC25_9FUNG|nr:hypothetical protein LPJ61_003934 [Coemansia biformis]
MAKLVSVSSYNTAGVGGRKPLGKASPLANSFSLIEYDKDHRFLIMDCPTNSTIPLYLKEFARLNVTDVVRVCEPTYLKERVESRNVHVHPPPSVLKQWRELVITRVSTPRSESESSAEPSTIAVHCVAGLGRAPVLVAVALIEKGMDPLDAIEHVRLKRRGAFNNRQITYLAENYKRASGFKGAAKIGSAIRSSPLNGASSAQPSPVSSSGTQSDKAAAPGAGHVSSGIHKSFFKKMFGSH